MGKIVKYCSACEEGFAEKFGFCPNCGAPLEAFEMNPMTEKFESVPTEPNQTVENLAANEINQPSPVIYELPEEEAAKTVAFATDDEILEIDVEGENKPVEEPETTATVSAAAAFEPFPSQYQYQSFNNENTADEDDGYHLTVIDERDGGKRNALLLGSTVLILTVALGTVVYSLFAKNLDLAAIDTSDLPVYVVDDTVMSIEEPEKPKNDDEGGGGGGGGRDEPMETSKGRLADQMREEPLITPTKTIIQRDNPELVMQATTVGDKKFQQTVEPYGNPNSKSTFASDGQGTGGGQGSGVGTGQGSGRGTGAGSGTGSGFGSGIGNGNGDGTGDGSGRASNPGPPKPPPAAGPSKPLQITFKPKPRYTDAARQNNVQGSVTVKVTFLASGQIGSVTPVSGLGYGLTEQAIAAAKQMRFEPQLKNGVPQTVVRPVQFNFTIY